MSKDGNNLLTSEYIQVKISDESLKTSTEDQAQKDFRCFPFKHLKKEAENTLNWYVENNLTDSGAYKTRQKIGSFNWTEAAEKHNLKPSETPWHEHLKGKYFSVNMQRDFSCIRSGQIVKTEGQNDSMEGLGSKLVVEAKQLQEGLFVDDKLEGYGRSIYDSGGYYIGCYSKSLRHGQGTYYYENGTVKSCEWVNDK